MKLYLKVPALTRDAADAMTRLMDRSMSTLMSGGRAVVLDVRRGKEYRPRARLRRDFDIWMEAEARGLAYIWRAAA